MHVFVGFDVLAPHIDFGPVHQSDEKLRAALAAYAARLRNI